MVGPDQWCVAFEQAHSLRVIGEIEEISIFVEESLVVHSTSVA
jgi:hypothetical protein